MRKLRIAYSKARLKFELTQHGLYEKNNKPLS